MSDETGGKQHLAFTDAEINAAAGKSRSAMHAGLSGVSGLRVMIGPPVSRPPATFYITECGGMSPVAALIIILALLSLVLQ